MDNAPTPENPVERACRLAGGQAAVARNFGIKPPSVSQWCAKGWVPLDRCVDLEKLTGVRCEELRPDVDWAYLRGTEKAEAA